MNGGGNISLHDDVWLVARESQLTYSASQTTRKLGNFNAPLLSGSFMKLVLGI